MLPRGAAESATAAVVTWLGTPYRSGVRTGRLVRVSPLVCKAIGCSERRVHSRLHLAKCLEYCPPAKLNSPPTYKPGPPPSSKEAIACTRELSMPDPSGDHSTPLQRAIPLAVCPPAFVKVPPAYKAGPTPSSNTASELTGLLKLGPSDDHEVPSQVAILLAIAPPAVEKEPPAYKAGPVPPSKTASDRTVLFTPAPSGDHSVPSQRAI